jgi:hypothetical protein
MGKRQASKVRLNKETVRNLSLAALSAARGGAAWPFAVGHVWYFRDGCGIDAAEHPGTQTCLAY